MLFRSDYSSDISSHSEIQLICSHYFVAFTVKPLLTHQCKRLLILDFQRREEFCPYFHITNPETTQRSENQPLLCNTWVPQPVRLQLCIPLTIKSRDPRTQTSTDPAHTFYNRVARRTIGAGAGLMRRPHKPPGSEKPVVPFPARMSDDQSVLGDRCAETDRIISTP